MSRSQAPIPFPHICFLNTIIDYSFSFSRDVHLSEEKFSGPTLSPDSQVIHLENKMRYSKSVTGSSYKTFSTNPCLLPLLQPTFSAHCSCASTPTLCLEFICLHSAQANCDTTVWSPLRTSLQILTHQHQTLSETTAAPGARYWCHPKSFTTPILLHLT